MPPPTGTAERDNPARLLPANLQCSCSGLSWEQLIDLFRAVLPSYTKHAASACLAQHGSSLPQALRDLHQARACDWLAQDEYDAEVSKLISCTAAITIHASSPTADAPLKPNPLRQEPASLCAPAITPARDHVSPISLPNPKSLFTSPPAVPHDRVPTGSHCV